MQTYTRSSIELLRGTEGECPKQLVEFEKRYNGEGRSVRNYRLNPYSPTFSPRYVKSGYDLNPHSRVFVPSNTFYVVRTIRGNKRIVVGVVHSKRGALI